MNQQIIAIKANGYKTHLCSNADQVQSMLRDMKTRKPDSECSTRVWDLPYLCFDNGKPFVKESDFTVIELPHTSLKFCVADFTAMMCSINYALLYPVDNLVLLTSGLYCSVLTYGQSHELVKFIKFNYDKYKTLEDAYYRKYADQISALEAKVLPTNNKKYEIN